MAKDLVIVESPAKARTIERFLGKDVVAKASMGHVRDIPKREMGVNVEDLSFLPKYTVLPEKRKVVSELAKASKAASTVYLATDPDREGEAISWHLMKAAKIDESKAKRVVFHEITQHAVREAFENPRDLDNDLIDAQQARRVLDRIVGYELSPVLWRKVKRGLSAGRVQSVALRLVVDREQEIQAFKPKEYWTIEAALARRQADATAIKAALRAIEGRKGKLDIPDQAEATRIVADLDGAAYVVQKVTRKERRSRPAPPFITSTLQQEAARKLRFTARRTMQVAQQLYEGVNLGDQGSTGLITYMRTDSTNVSSLALSETGRYVKEKFGENYAPPVAPSLPAQGQGRAGSPRGHTADERLRRARKGATAPHERAGPAVRAHLEAHGRQPDGRRALRLDQGRHRGNERQVGLQIRLPGRGSVLKFPGFRRLYMEDVDDKPRG